MDQLRGKVVAVAGAAGSTGRGIALRFAHEGAKIALIDRDSAKCDALVKEIQTAGGTATFIRADIAAQGDAQRAVDAAASAYGRLDVLVNSNWVLRSFTPLLEKPEEDFEASMHAVFFGTLRAMRAAVPHMRKAGGGRIINVAAPYGYTSFHNIADAVSTDWSLQGLTRVAAVEWGKYQILVNLLVPALLDIPEFQQYRAENPAYVDGLLKQMPLRRLGDPIEDLGGAALLLATDEGCFITGQPIFSDGGQHLNTATFKPRARRV
jgi:NAD(P)-dependent dehydrogenase (short-subunit alcohol dehydrogenase family)